MEGLRGSLDEILRWLKTKQYTGAIVVHLRAGEPQIVEHGRPSRFEIVPGLPTLPGAPREKPLTPAKQDP